MRWVVLIVTASLLGSSAAAAEAPSPIDPARLALAHELVAATGGKAAVEARLRQVFGTAFTAMTKDWSADAQTMMADFNRDLQDEIAAMIPSMLETTEKAYARHLSEKELRDLLAWQTSETGKSVASKLPSITQEVIEAQLPLMKDMTPRIMRKMFERMCQRKACTPEQRDAMEKRLRT